MHKDLYNAAVANRRTQYEHFGRSVNYFEQQNCLPAFKQVWPEYKVLGSHALQATLKRVDIAYQRFFQGLGGHPKFKSIRHYSGWTYPDRAGWKAHTTGDNGYLELSNLGSIAMRGKAKMWGTPTTCTIVHRHGKWDASITLRVSLILLQETLLQRRLTVNCESAQRELGTGAIGIDFGTKTAAAISDGENGQFIDNPRWFGTALPKIKKASKEKRRKRAPNRKKRIKASRRWKRANKKVAKLQRKAANQRQNWIHHQAIQIVSGNSLIASEKLEVKNMTAKAKKAHESTVRLRLPQTSRKGGKRKRQKAGLNRSILDVGWGMLKGAVRYKLEEGGGVFVDVPTRTVKPSQTCPKCWHQQKKELSERVHYCQKCGYTQDRDLAAAEVMILWAKGILPGLGTSLVDVDGSSSTAKTKKRKRKVCGVALPPAKLAKTHCGSIQQLGQKKRQKSQPAGGDVETPSSRSRAG